MLVLRPQSPRLLASPTPFQEPRARVSELEPTDRILSAACCRFFCLFLWDVSGFVCFGICSLLLRLRFTRTQPLLPGLHTACDHRCTMVAGLSGTHLRDPTASTSEPVSQPAHYSKGLWMLTACTSAQGGPLKLPRDGDGKM